MVSSISIRQAVESDLQALVFLDAVSNPHPWGESLVLDALKTRKNWVVEQVEEKLGKTETSLLGWLTASQWGDQSELELIVVSLVARRQGYAKKLMAAWLYDAAQHNVTEYLLEVRESNISAISLYKSLDFELVGRRKNYYQTELGYEAACLFTLKV